jgi:hypothetical protein
MLFAYVFLMYLLKLIVLEVGMAFKSEGKAYAMYNAYVDMVGFSIRKSTTKC